MNNLVTFNFNNNQVRTEIIDNEPWFCGVDVCNALSIKNNRNVISRLSDGVHNVDIIDKLGRKQSVSYINEANLYKIAFQSRKPQAEPFVSWVCKEVLPSIRKTGHYGTPAPVDMKAIGGMVKRCCAAAVRAEIQTMTQPGADMQDMNALISYIVEERVKNTIRVRYEMLLAENAELKDAIKNAKKCLIVQKSV